MGTFAATADRSATVRPGQCGSCCQAGLATYAEHPLAPAPMPGWFHTRSLQPRGLPDRASWVPPTAVTVDRSAGEFASPNPLSPAETTIVWPGWSYAFA